MRTQAESTRATLGRVGGFLVGVILAALCALRSLGDVLRAVGAVGLEIWSDGEFEGIDLTPFVIGAAIWAVLAVVAVWLGYVVLTPGRPRRATTLAAVGIAGVAVGYGIDMFVAYTSTSS